MMNGKKENDRSRERMHGEEEESRKEGDERKEKKAERGKEIGMNEIGGRGQFIHHPMKR